MHHFRIFFIRALLASFIALSLVSFAEASMGSHQQEVPSSRSYGDDVSLDKLHEAATSDHTVTRIDAIRRIATEANPASLQTLIHALKDSEPKVREIACMGLGKLGRPESVPALVAVMNDENVSVRNQAAVAVAGIKPSAAVINNFLTGLDKQYSKTVGRKGRMAVTHATSQSGTGNGREYSNLGQSSLVMSKKVLRRLVAGEPAAGKFLIAALTDANPMKRYTTAYALSTSIEPGVSAAFERALMNKDMAVVSGAYEYYLANHIIAAKDVLLLGLNEFDDPDLILALSRCGDSDLELAAAQVANVKGVRLGYR